MRLETDRLILRSWHDSDAEELYKYAQNQQVTERDDECELGYWLGVPYWGTVVNAQSNSFFQIHNTVTAPTTQNTKLVR